LIDFEQRRREEREMRMVCGLSLRERLPSTVRVCAVAVLALLSMQLCVELILASSAEVSKPWISYNFSCNTTLEAGGETQTMQWYQDFDFQTIFTIGLFDDYMNHIEDVRNTVSVNYNTTNMQCDWVCRQSRCCYESNNNSRNHPNSDNKVSSTTKRSTKKSKITAALEMVSEMLRMGDLNSSGGGEGNTQDDGCGCSTQILPILMWEYYSVSRYLG